MKTAVKVSIATAMAALSGFLLPASAQGSGFVAAAVNCLTAPGLNQAVKTDTPLSSDVRLRTFTFSPGIANASMFKSKVSVLQGNLATSNLKIVRQQIGEAVRQDILAGQPGALGYINTDFFDESRGLNASAIIENGILTFAPPARTGVVGFSQVVYRIETGFSAKSSFYIAASKFLLSGVNVANPPAANSVIAYTAKYFSTELPGNAGGVLIAGGKVSKVFKSEIKVRPKSGVLILASGLNATRLAKMKVGSSTTFKMPAVPGPRREIKTAQVTSSGTATVNNVSIPIVGVNTDTASSGARLYDSNFTTSRGTVSSDYTIVIDSSGLVKSKSKWSKARVPSGGAVLQIGSSGWGFYNAASVGARVTLSNSYSATGGVNLITAWGSGGRLLQAGANLMDCEPRHEQIRPRTGFAWNPKTGDFWMITTSSGQNLNDFGFRMGGSTSHQLFDWMKQLGATEGVLLDGGGTTSMFARIAGSVERVDIPNEAWIRSAPMGLVVTAND